VGTIAGFPPQVVRQWNLYQLRMMTCDRTELGGTVMMSREAGQALRERRRSESQEFVENLMRSRVWRGPLG
jgi:hypothetical protein